MVATAILKYFNNYNCKIGQLIKYDDILNEIYAINGVSNVRTIFEPPEDALGEKKTIIKNGISFASYSTKIINDALDDLDISNISRKLEDFQFPEFYVNQLNSSNIADHIKVITKSMANTSPIKF